MTRTVGDLLKEKGSEVWWVQPDQTAHEAVRIMLERNAGALVVREGGRVVGIVSERDLVRKVAGTRRDFEKTAVGEIMTRDVIYLRPDETIEQAMAVMTSQGIRHLPVLEGEALAGMVSVRDLIKEVVADKDYLISQLEHFIRGQ
jgi:CBS domain-containing protein